MKAAGPSLHPARGVRVVERAERRLVPPLQRRGDTPAQPESFDALTYDLLEPTVANRPARAALLPDQVDQQRGHLVTLVAILDHRNPDTKIQTLQLALGTSDRYREIVGRPGFEQSMGNFARPCVEQDLG